MSQECIFPPSEAKPLTKGKRTRMLLLSVAASRFAENGFEQTRISDIVAGAHVSQPVFYQYFATKQAAYDELVDIFSQRLRHTIALARLPEAMPPVAVEGRLRDAVWSLLRILQEDPHLTRIGFFQAPAAQALKDELVDMMAANVSAEQAAGFFRSDLSAQWFAQSLMGVIERFTQQLPDALKQQSLADFVSDLLLNGMQQRSATGHASDA